MPAPAPTPTVPAYAIVGAGCVLPGAGHLADYEAALLDGRSGIVDVRTIDGDFQRDFQSEDKREAKTYSALSGRVADHLIACPAEVPAADFAAFTRPQKLLAMALAEAVRPCAAATASRIRGGEGVSVIVGATADGCDEFEQALLREDLEARLPARRDEVRSLFDASAQADSDSLSLRPSLQQAVRAVCGRELPLDVLDAACASSLFAVHSGMHLLSTGRASVVVAGGVFSPGPGNSCLFAQFGGLSADGSRPFDVSASGVVFGEGAAVVVLKKLEDALADGDRVFGVIRGSGLSSDGKSSSANVPRAAGQKLAMQRAYESSGLAPESVQYVEAHGTATPRGDATEIESIGAVFAGRREPLVLGSVKSQIGHTGWTAGTASLLKVCFFLREGRFPVQHGLRQVSADIARHEGRLRVPTQSEAWPAPAGEPRRAGVNGFGFGGTNAHLVVEAFVPAYHERWRGFRPAAAADRRFVVVGRALFLPDAEGGLSTDVSAEGAASFSRKRIPLPARVPMLPDLHESLDIGQLLALRGVEAALASAPGLEAAVADAHAATAVVISLEGRALSGIQSSQRIYRDRLLRKAGAAQDALAPSLDVVEGEPVRLGPYTLQGMMQNVVSGRIANAWDLQGPNFVLEQGDGGFSAALAHGRACLTQGSEFAIVAAMQANARFPRRPRAPMREAIAVWVVASEETARARGLAVLAEAPAGRLPAQSGRWSFGPVDDFPELGIAAAAPAPAVGTSSGFSVEATVDAYTPTWRPATLPAASVRVPRTVLLVDGSDAASARPWLAGLGFTVIDDSAPASREADLILAVVDGARARRRAFRGDRAGAPALRTLRGRPDRPLRGDRGGTQPRGRAVAGRRRRRGLSRALDRPVRGRAEVARPRVPGGFGRLLGQRRSRPRPGVGRAGAFARTAGPRARAGMDPRPHPRARAARGGVRAVPRLHPPGCATARTRLGRGADGRRPRRHRGAGGGAAAALRLRARADRPLVVRRGRGPAAGRRSGPRRARPARRGGMGGGRTRLLRSAGRRGAAPPAA